jgi:hypothetical protein
MLTYFISESPQYENDNIWTIRVQPTGSSNLTLYLQDMTTQQNSSASLLNYSYDAYESKLSFTGSLVQTLLSASVGTQYRAYISDTTCSIWHGSISVFTPQNVNKSSYVNQIPLENVYVSNVTNNDYIILD